MTEIEKIAGFLPYAPLLGIVGFVIMLFLKSGKKKTKTRKKRR